MAPNWLQLDAGSISTSVGYSEQCNRLVRYDEKARPVAVSVNYEHAVTSPSRGTSAF